MASLSVRERKLAETAHVRYCRAMGSSVSLEEFMRTREGAPRLYPDISVHRRRHAPVSIMETLKREGFSVFVDMLERVGLENMADVTIFAPTDEAWQRLGAEARSDLARDDDLLRHVLEYHMLAGEVKLSAFQTKNERTVEGSSLGVKVGEHGRVTLTDKSEDRDEIDIYEGDIAATNGIIHPIGVVMLTEDAWERLGRHPSIGLPRNILDVFTAKKSILDIVRGRADLSTLESLIVKSGLAASLDANGPLTLLAPNNDAFAKVPKEKLDVLAANHTKLRDVLMYHMLVGTLDTTMLVSSDAYQTMLYGETLKVFVKDWFGPHMHRVINGHARLEVGDLYASNGVVHIISEVLFPGKTTVSHMREGRPMRPRSGMPAAGRQMPALVPVGRQMPALVPVGRQMPALVPTERQMPALVPAERQMPALVPIGRRTRAQMPALVPLAASGQRQMPALVPSGQRQMPALMPISAASRRTSSLATMAPIAPGMVSACAVNRLVRTTGSAAPMDNISAAALKAVVSDLESKFLVPGKTISGMDAQQIADLAAELRVAVDGAGEGAYRYLSQARMYCSTRTAAGKNQLAVASQVMLAEVRENGGKRIAGAFAIPPRPVALISTLSQAWQRMQNEILADISVGKSDAENMYNRVVQIFHPAVKMMLMFSKSRTASDIMSRIEFFAYVANGIMEAGFVHLMTEHKHDWLAYIFDHVLRKSVSDKTIVTGASAVGLLSTRTLPAKIAVGFKDIVTRAQRRSGGGESYTDTAEEAADVVAAATKKFKGEELHNVAHFINFACGAFLMKKLHSELHGKSGTKVARGIIDDLIQYIAVQWRPAV